MAAAATFSGKNTRACMQFRSTQALHCWLVACRALIVPAVEGCPSFTSSVEEGRAVCPGEELTYTCTMTGSSATVWKITPQPCDGLVSFFIMYHNTDTFKRGPFSARLSASDGDCYTSTVTVTASLELNGTVIACSDNPGNVTGNAVIQLGRCACVVAQARTRALHVFTTAKEHTV